MKALREIAQVESCWPIMARPNDPNFSEAKLKKLGVGKGAIIAEATKSKHGAPPSLNTSSNRITDKLVKRLDGLASALAIRDDADVLGLNEA